MKQGNEKSFHPKDASSCFHSRKVSEKSRHLVNESRAKREPQSEVPEMQSTFYRCVQRNAFRCRLPHQPYTFLALGFSRNKDRRGNSITPLNQSRRLEACDFFVKVFSLTRVGRCAQQPSVSDESCDEQNHGKHH